MILGELEGPCSTHERDEKCKKNYFEYLKGRDHGLDDRIILKWFLNI
jgi:hypothetical protein